LLFRNGTGGRFFFLRLPLPEVELLLPVNLPFSFCSNVSPPPPRFAQDVPRALIDWPLALLTLPNDLLMPGLEWTLDSPVPSPFFPFFLLRCCCFPTLLFPSPNPHRLSSSGPDRARAWRFPFPLAQPSPMAGFGPWFASGRQFFTGIALD